MLLDMFDWYFTVRTKKPFVSINFPLALSTFLVAVFLLVVGVTPVRTRADENFAVFGLQFSPDGKFLAAASNSVDPPGPIVLWNVSDWSIAAIHRPDAGSLDLDFSTDGELLAYGTKQGKVGIIDLLSGNLLLEFEAHTEAVFSVAFLPNAGSLLSAGADHKIHRWNTKTGELLGSFDGHTDAVYGIAVSPDGLTLVSGGIDKRVQVWDIPSRKSKKTFQSGSNIVRRVSFSSDGAYFLTSRWDGNVRIRSTETGQLRARLGSGSNCADIAYDNRLVATVGFGSTAYVYAVELGAPSNEEQAEISHLIATFQEENYDRREKASQRILAMGMIAEPQLREAMRSKWAEIRVRARALREKVLSPQPLAELPGHTGDVEVVDFSHDGKLLATACRGGDIKVWDSKNFQELVTLRLPSAKNVRLKE